MTHLRVQPSVANRKSSIALAVLLSVHLGCSRGSDFDPPAVAGAMAPALAEHTEESRFGETLPRYQRAHIELLKLLFPLLAHLQASSASKRNCQTRRTRTTLYLLELA